MSCAAPGPALALDATDKVPVIGLSVDKGICDLCKCKALGSS